ncbi:unnamed protein product [Discula destructiva]
MELGLSTCVVGDPSKTARSKLYVADGQAKAQRRMSKRFDKGDTELVDHQGLLNDRLTAILHDLQQQFETVALVVWDVANDPKWLTERVGWRVPAGVTVVDVQLATMHKHHLKYRARLFDVLNEL